VFDYIYICLFAWATFQNMAGPTLIKPRPADPSKSAMENVLELVTLRDFGPAGIQYPSPEGRC